MTKGVRMRGSVLEVRTSTDGSVVIAPHGEVGLDNAVELRQVLVHQTPARLRRWTTPVVPVAVTLFALATHRDRGTPDRRRPAA